MIPIVSDLLVLDDIDYMTTELWLGNIYLTTYQSREDWKSGRVIEPMKLSHYTDGSKMR